MPLTPVTLAASVSACWLWAWVCTVPVRVTIPLFAVAVMCCPWSDESCWNADATFDWMAESVRCCASAEVEMEIQAQTTSRAMEALRKNFGLNEVWMSMIFHSANGYSVRLYIIDGRRSSLPCYR